MNRLAELSLVERHWIVLAGVCAINGLLLTTIGCGSAGASAAAGSNDGGQVDDQPDLPNEPGGQEELMSVNEGGGDLAERVGGATYDGDANGPTVSGSLFVTFDDNGVLTSLGGTVLGQFLGLGADTEAIFDYQTNTVGGTHQASSAEAGPLGDFLTATEQSIELRNIIVLLTLDSLLITTTYNADIAGHPAGDQVIQLEGTVRFQTNEDIQGGLILPGVADSDVPVFVLLLQ